MTYAKNSKTAVCAVIAATILAALVGCGGYNSSNSMTYTPPATTGSTATAHASVNIGDSPSDRVVAFEFTINSIVLTAADNTTVSLLSQPRRIEVTHLSATTEPLSLMNIPQGTYKSAAISISAPDAVVIDNGGNEVETNNSTMTTTVTVTFNPALVVGAAPVVLNIDANVANSLTINSTTGAVTFNPAFTITTGSLPAAGHEGEEDDDDGELEHIIGAVTQINGASFTIQIGQTGTTMTFASNANTKIEGAASVAALPIGAIVRVEGNTQQDGSLLATEVELLSNMAAEIEGFVSGTTGSPVSSFTLVLQDDSGSGSSSLSLGSNITVNVNSSTGFQVDDGSMDLGGISLPSFSAATLTKAQRVEIDNDAPVTGTTITAKVVKLEQQAVVGTVSGLSGSQFTLTVASDSAFAILTGKSTIAVVGAKNLQVSSSAMLANGAVLRVRGLLFFDPISGSYRLFASRITNP